MAFRVRLFRFTQPRFVKRLKDVNDKEVRVIPFDEMSKALRNIDYDLATRERATRYQRRIERFCRT